MRCYGLRCDSMVVLNAWKDTTTLEKIIPDTGFEFPRRQGQKFVRQSSPKRILCGRVTGSDTTPFMSTSKTDYQKQSSARNVTRFLHETSPTRGFTTGIYKTGSGSVEGVTWLKMEGSPLWCGVTKEDSVRCYRCGVEVTQEDHYWMPLQHIYLCLPCWRWMVTHYDIPLTKKSN